MALTDVEHVEAVALINGILDHAPSLPLEIRAGAERWLEQHHPAPTAYMAAMKLLAGQDPEPVGVDRGRELCHAHGAYSPEGDCFVCDTQQARERAEAVEAKLIDHVLRESMRQHPQPFDLDFVMKFTDLDREHVEQALERLEEEDKVRADYAGRDRPHWTVVID